jgi:hypothetical protein
MLKNMFLQAKSLDIFYESKVFKTDEISRLDELGVTNAVATILL